jgi:uncharacterized membrane protein
MTTPILMLLLMTAPYAAARLLSAITHRNRHASGAAAAGLSFLFVFTGIGHFTETQAMSQMLLPWVPARVLLVYLAGVLEFAIAAGFLIPRSRRFTGWVAAAVLLLFFPANIYAAIHHIPMGGHAWGWFTIRRHPAVTGNKWRMTTNNPAQLLQNGRASR